MSKPGAPNPAPRHGNAQKTKRNYVSILGMTLIVTNSSKKSSHRCIYEYIYIYTHVCVCLYVLYVYTYVCIHVYIYNCIDIYTAYIYIYISSLSLSLDCLNMFWKSRPVFNQHSGVVPGGLRILRVEALPFVHLSRPFHLVPTNELRVAGMLPLPDPPLV